MRKFPSPPPSPPQKKNENGECVHLIFAMRFSSMTSESGWRDFERKFSTRCIALAKNGEWHKTVRRKCEAFQWLSPTNTAILPRQNLHTEELRRFAPFPLPSSATIFATSFLISFIAIVRFPSFSSALRIIAFFFRFIALWECTSLSFPLLLSLSLSSCVSNNILVCACPLLIHEKCGINKATSSGKTINPERRPSNLLNGKRKRVIGRKEREREKGAVSEKRVQ